MHRAPLAAARAGARRDRETYERAADLLSEDVSDRLRGLYDIVQNADDAGATRLALGVRTRWGVREFLFVHDGRPISANDLVAMTAPFDSTKVDDPGAIGFLGVGLKMLALLGAKDTPSSSSRLR